jgi:hypothetical protein
MDFTPCAANAVSLGHADRAMENGQGLAAELLLLDGNWESGGVERTCSGTAGGCNSRDAGTVDDDTMPSGHGTMQVVHRCPPCPEEPVANHACYQSIAVVPPAPPQKRKRIARTTATTTAWERRLWPRPSHGGNRPLADKDAIDTAKRSQEAQHSRRKIRNGPILRRPRDPTLGLSDCSRENQMILWTCHSHSSAGGNGTGIFFHIYARCYTPGCFWSLSKG